MPHDDYTASTGGALKLKGVNPASKISKPHRKKRPKPPQPSDTAVDAAKAGEKDAGDGIVGESGLSRKEGSEQRQDEGEDGKSVGEGDEVDGVTIRAGGKTDAERRHEDRRRKRVCGILTTDPSYFFLTVQTISTLKTSPLSSIFLQLHTPSSTPSLFPTQSLLTNSVSPPFLITTQLDERLKREGTKTHKERVEELNRYLSNLSEHHDMYVTCPPPRFLVLVFLV